MIKLLHGDCLEEMRTLPANSVDSIVTDPPYGISFMAKKWDYDVPSVEVWKEALRVLKPGGHALIACGTRTQHRMACKIEDAGFEIRDVVSWIYGSGFPKSLNISKAIDKAAGAEREVVGVTQGKGGENINRLSREGGNDADDAKGCGAYGLGAKQVTIDIPITAPATDEAKQWDGWGTALKPSTEYFTLAQKPLEGGSDLCIVEEINQILLCLLQSYVTTVKNHSASSQSELSAAASIAQWIADENTNTLEGLCDLMATLQSESEMTTSLSIALSCLSTLVESLELANTFTTSMKSSLTTELKILKSVKWESIFQDSIHPSETQASGLPASASDVVNLLNGVSVKLNYIRTHSVTDSASSVQLDPKVACEFFTLCRKPLSEKTVATNVLKWGTGGINIDACRVGTESTKRANSTATGSSVGKAHAGQENGSESGRFPANLIHDGSQEVLDLFPETKTGSIKPHKNEGSSFQASKEITGSHKGDQGSAARFFYCPKASKKDRNEGLLEGETSTHPTVKPTALMQYLCRLITPTGGVVLDLYMGSGSTGKAAVKEGLSFVGIEMNPDYVDICHHRIAASFEFIV